MTDEKREAVLGERLVKQDVITREELKEAQAREAATGTPWYRQMLQMGKISFGAIEDVLKYEWHPMSLRKEHETLGQALVKMKVLSQGQLDKALAEQDRSGRLLGNILLDRGFVTRDSITRALSKQHGLEHTDLAKTPSDPDALEAVPESMARKYQMLPVRIEGDRLTVLIASPQGREPLGAAGVMLGKRLYPIMTTAHDIGAEIAKRYAKQTDRTRSAEKAKSATAQTGPSRQEKVMVQPKATAVVEGDKVEAPHTNSERSALQEIAREASGMPVIKLVKAIMEGAVNVGATDIHLDPEQPEMRVRYRIDGILHDVMSIPSDIQGAVVSRVKILSDMDITETRRPQDGHVGLDGDDLAYDVRVATLPTFLGERVVLRLLDQSSVLCGIKDLGLEPQDQKAIQRMIAQPYGMILVTGPTGSGKTTTLYAALNQKNVITDSIVTLEDPVEYQLSGINQVQIDPDIDVTFANTLRAALRQDIDVLLVGEIRDPETAHIAIRAAMTGHLVFSTLHTNDAPEAITTLRNMGVASYLISSALTSIIAQRLVRTICSTCKTAFKPTKGMLKSIGLPPSTAKLHRGKGCEACYHTRTKGRTGIFEVLEVTGEIRKLIAVDAPIEKITTSRVRTMADRCRLKVKRGIVAPEEFFRVIRT